VSTQDKNGSVNENHQSSDGDGVEGGEGGGGGVVVRVVVDGDREDTDQAASPGERNDPAEQEEKERPGPKAGKTKRRRPPHRCESNMSSRTREVYQGFEDIVFHSERIRTPLLSF